jgi:hypothetical protein
MLGSLAQRRRREKGHDFRRQKFAIIDPILRLFTDALTLQDQKGRLGRIKQRTQRLCGLVANVSINRCCSGRRVGIRQPMLGATLGMQPARYRLLDAGNVLGLRMESS